MLTSSCAGLQCKSYWYNTFIVLHHHIIHASLAPALEPPVFALEITTHWQWFSDVIWCIHKMATYAKPGERYATSDWFTSNYVISTDAERQRVVSHETRQESRYLRNETSNRTKWDQHDNNTRLADRVDHIRKSVYNFFCGHISCMVTSGISADILGWSFWQQVNLCLGPIRTFCHIKVFHDWKITSIIHHDLW